MTMKTSNKILLGFLLVGFGFLAATRIRLHVKYTHNDYVTPEQYNSSFYDEYTLSDIKHVRLLGVAQCQVIPSNSTKLQVEKSGMSYIKFNVSRDTLFIHGEFPADHPSGIKVNRNSQGVKVYLPRGINIYAINSDIEVLGNKTAVDGGSWHFDINSCILNSRENNLYSDSVNRYFDTLSVNAKYSRVMLFRYDHFKAVNVRLDHSLIEDRKATIGQVNLITDSSSILNISGGNINKLNSTIIGK
jgi:hypothetical protein